MSMRKPEQALWDKIRDEMAGHWRADRVENKILQGMPDVYFSVSSGLTGWMELKVINQFPKGDHHVVRIPHYTPFQANWHWTHRDFGTKSWIVIQVEEEVFFFAARMALALFEGMSVKDFRKSARIVDLKKMDNLKIVDALLQAR